MSITNFTPIENELFELASNSDAIREYDVNYLAPLKTVVIIDICGTIALDSEKWTSICYGGIERIANEVVMNIIHQ